MKKIFFTFTNFISYCAKWFLKYLLITVTLIFTGVKGCQYYEVYLIKKNKIPKEFNIIETVYSNASIGCGVAIFKVTPPKVDILKIHHPIFEQFYTGMNLDELLNSKPQIFSKKTVGPVLFAKSCIEQVELNNNFLQLIETSSAYYSVGGENVNGQLIVYDKKTNLIYYSIDGE